ncbi:MAG: helix-turn-helix domain-containing protein [Zhongshania sp.]|uniref:helix-turn-helix domain-containing protein n=1 Tax=Zhongshania sp. TaxID=1971902 RepID=UPI0026099FDF|nr:helix-turn-helix domain-containing protein [Zhongshania sp.]MDF1693756.1 helix-turn-helix domain-containing protein [Zhongshania sp.]
MAKYIGNALFGATLRQCRKQRNFSQQFVASAAGISSRHLSFVECNKTGVSRKTLARIFTVLELPPSQEEMLLQLAGFASRQSAYNEINLNEALPRPIQQVLDVYSPYPAYLLDRQLNIVSMNTVSKLYLEYFEINLKYFKGKPNLLLSVVDQSSLKPYFFNWHEVVKSMIWRLRNHARRAPEVEVFEHLEREATASEDVREALRLEPNERALHGINNILIGGAARSVEFTHITSSFHGPISNGHSPRFFVESFIPSNEKSALLFEQCIADLPTRTSNKKF